MFVRAIEGFVGRVVILLALVLLVGSCAFFGTQELSGAASPELVDNAVRYWEGLIGWLSNQIDAARAALGI